MRRTTGLEVLDVPNPGNLAAVVGVSLGNWYVPRYAGGTAGRGTGCAPEKREQETGGGGDSVPVREMALSPCNPGTFPI